VLLAQQALDRTNDPVQRKQAMGFMRAVLASLLTLPSADGAKTTPSAGALFHSLACAPVRFSDVGRTLVPPSAASGRETGVGEPLAGSRQYTVCPAHAVTARALPLIRHDASRWGAVAQLPGAMRMLFAPSPGYR
jgi:hypothetical protein